MEEKTKSTGAKTPVTSSPAQTVVYAAPNNGMAVASFVLSFVGWIIPILPSVLAVIFGIVALSQIKKSGEQGRGFAIAGLIIGAIPIAIALVFLVIWLIAILFFGVFAISSNS